MATDPVQRQTGLKKAAAFLAVLPEEEREMILQNFSDAETGALRRQILQLDPIPAEVVRALRTEFLQTLSSTKETNFTSTGSLRYLPEPAEEKKSPSSEEEETVPGITRGKNRPFISAGLRPTPTRDEESSSVQIRVDSEHSSQPNPHFFNRRKTSTQEPTEKNPLSRNAETSTLKQIQTSSPRTLAEQLAKERSQTIAVILSTLEEKIRSEVISHFPERVQKEIQRRIHSLGTIDPIVYETIRQTLFSDFSPCPASAPASPMNREIQYG